MQEHDIPHGSPVRSTPRPASPETRVGAVESSERAPRGVIKVLERAVAPDLVPEWVMLGGIKVDITQYIAEIASIARHRGVRMPPDQAPSGEAGQADAQA